MNLVKRLKHLALTWALFSTLLAWSAEGPTVLFEGDPTMLTTTVMIVVQRGSALDPYDKIGLANLSTELMLRGTKTHSRSQFQSELERLGGTMAVRTSHDHVAFIGMVIKENTKPLLQLMESVIVTPALQDKELKGLKREILSEISHVKNSNNRLAGLAVRRELFAGTSLERPSDGGLKSVKSISLKDIRAFYKESFVRGNVFFAVATPAPESEMKASLQSLWKKLPEGVAKKATPVNLSIPASPKLLVIHKPKTSTGVVAFGQGGTTATDPDRFALVTSNFSFGGEPLVARLFRIVRSELGWTYAIISSYNSMGSLSLQRSPFTISMTPSIEFTSKAIFKVMELWEKYLTQGLEKKELTLAQESMVNSYPFEFETAENRLSKKIHSQLYGVPVLSQEEFQDKIEDVSSKKIIESLASHQSKNGWVIAVVADADMLSKQLEEEQKDVPADKRLKIAKRLRPEDLVE